MHTASRPSPISSRPPVPAPLILVAEDDDEMRTLLTRALRRDGYEVQSVGDGGALVAALADAREGGREPDLIVSDLRMPGLDGLAMVERLRASGCTVPVVLVSGFVEPAMAERARALGVAHVLSKPFELDDLRTVAMHLLAHPRNSQ